MLHTSHRDIYEIHTFEIYMTPTNYISIFLKQYHCHSSQSLFGTCCHFSLFLFHSLTFFSHPHSLLSSFTRKHTHTLNLDSYTNTFCFTLTYHLYVTFFHSFSLWLSLLLSLSIFLYHFHSFIQFPLSFSLKSYHTSNCAF